MPTSTKRLLKEATELSTSPSPHFTAAPISDTNLHDWHFTLTGPPSPSPFNRGIYHGRILFPPTYPLRPPSFRFLTPTGRFEVNREICLSISGHHEESWQPAWGVRTALTAIRSFMDGDAKGQVGGLDVGVETRRELAEKSREWVCGVCAGVSVEEGGVGRERTNEEAIGEWRGFCQERGVVLEGDGESERLVAPGREDVSSGERSSQGGLGQDSTVAATGATTTAQPPSPLPPLPPPETSRDEETSQPQPGQQPLSATDSSSQTQSVPQSQPQLPTQPQPQQPQVQPQTAPPAPTSSQPLQQPQSQPIPVQVQATAQNNDPWLDRAIIGVLIALVFMILRRVLSSEADDYL